MAGRPNQATPTTLSMAARTSAGSCAGFIGTTAISRRRATRVNRSFSDQPQPRASHDRDEEHTYRPPADGPHNTDQRPGRSPDFYATTLVRTRLASSALSATNISSGAFPRGTDGLNHLLNGGGKSARFVHIHYILAHRTKVRC